MLSMSAHWTILQSVAWTGMMIDFSRHASFKEALQNTFDGQHPCRMCKLVKAGRNEEGKQAQVNFPLKLDFFVTQVSGRVLFPPWIEAEPLITTASYCWLTDSPPTPPPRLT